MHFNPPIAENAGGVTCVVRSRERWRHPSRRGASRAGDRIDLVSTTSTSSCIKARRAGGWSADAPGIFAREFLEAS